MSASAIQTRFGFHENTATVIEAKVVPYGNSDDIVAIRVNARLSNGREVSLLHPWRFHVARSPRVEATVERIQRAGEINVGRWMEPRNIRFIDENGRDTYGRSGVLR